MAEKLEFDLLVGKNDLKKELDSNSSYANSLSSYFSGGVRPSIEAAREETKLLNSELGSFLKNTAAVAAGQLAFAAMTTAVNFLTNSVKGSIEEFSKQEESLNKLGQALRTTGSYSESSVYTLNAYADNLEAISVYGGDAIATQLAFAKSLGITNEQAKDLVKAAANLSSTLGGSLEENVDKLGKTFSGSAGRLASYIPELKNLTKEQLQAGAAAEVINSKFSGAASNDLETYKGSVEALGNSFGKLQEELGESIVKSETFQNSMKGLKKTIDDANLAIAGDKVWEDYAKGQGIASKTSEQLAVDFDTLNREIERTQESIKEAEGRTSFSKFFFGQADLAIAKRNLDDYVKLRQEIEEKLTYSRSSTKSEPTDTAIDKSASLEEIEAMKKRNAEILALDEQLRIERANFKLEEANVTIEQEAAKNAAEIQRIYDFETQKKEVESQLKANTAAATLEGEALRQEQVKISKEKELALLTAYNKKEVDLARNTAAETTRLKKAAIEDQVRNLGYVNQQTAASFALGAALAKDGSKEQFAINQAAAVAQIFIARATGVANALMLPPPAIPAAIANANIIAGLSLATVAATAIKGYANGGFVGGMNGVSGGGDDQLITAKSGELYLNGPQQKKLFDAINSGTLGGGGDIVLMIDNREVARAVRTAKSEGFVV